jgi:hypothetical protein
MITMNSIPHTLEATTCTDLAPWIIDNKELLRALLTQHGAVLLRGFNVCTEKHFDMALGLCCRQRLKYTYRSTPRTDLGQGLYTASEYPPGLTIPLHNENAYQRDWPLLIMFCCLKPADNREGQTPLADIVEVTARIDARIRTIFDAKNVLYIRNYYQNIDIPWQVVFQTDSIEAVSAFCREHGIDFQWKANGSLQTWQLCQSFATHPLSHSRLWFNQAHLFHPSGLDDATRGLMSTMFRTNEFPRNVTFGDGSPIEDGMLADIRHAFEQSKSTFEWRKGDVLVLDNMRVAHGRTSYKGERRVLVGMGDPFSSSHALIP